MRPACRSGWRRPLRELRRRLQALAAAVVTGYRGAARAPAALKQGARRARSARAFRRAMRGITIPAPFSLERFCGSVAERRGRQVAVIGIPGVEPGWPGAWLSTREADLVCYPAAASGPRRDQVVVHHLCHILLGHRPRPAAGLAAMIAPAAGRQFAGLLLGGDEAPAAGGRYADEAEAEQAADAMSSVILARASRGRARAGRRMPRSWGTARR